MKSIKLSLLLICLSLVYSCGENEELLRLAGAWRLESVTGGYTGRGIELPGDITIAIEDDKLQMFLDGTLNMKTDLILCKDDNGSYLIQNPEFQDLSKIFRLGYSEKMWIIWQGDTFLLNEGCSDCFSYRFNRI